jgi:hypothetical protein
VLKEFDSAILLYLTGYKRKCGIKFVGAFLNPADRIVPSGVALSSSEIIGNQGV